MRSHDIPWPARIRMLAIWSVMMLTGVVVLVISVPLGGQVTLQEGDVARSDVVAPRQITYVSEILTQQRTELAANAVLDVYDPPQARIGRQQLTLASQILDYIATVRSDSYAAQEEKTAYLDAISALDLAPEVATRILSLPAGGWERVAAEVLAVLERTMREEIRETNLTDERLKVVTRVRLDFPEEEAAVVSDIVRDLLVPNSFYNAERTEERRQSARQGVEPLTATVERNETILRAGDIVTAADIEALAALGLRQQAWTWADVWAAAGLMILLGVSMLYYFWRLEPIFWLGWREPIVLALLVVLYLALAKIVLPGHALLPYFFPYPAVTMLIGVLLSTRTALFVTALFTLVVGWLSNGSVELMAYALVPSVVGALKLRRGDSLAGFAWAAAYVAAANLLVVLTFRLAGGLWNLRALAELVSASVVNGLITMTVTIVGVYVAGALFGFTTPLQLMEVSRPTHPLLRQLLLKAPGTYHHTLIVSNMAERAAESIGADALLTRVGAYYHDVGKTIRPFFFIENRPLDGSPDPHARLDPYTSAQVIIAHVRDGMDLARKYRLPRGVIDFIPEHHGTLLVSYFYRQATKLAPAAPAAETVEKARFQYPGPRPQSRETAITMLADGAEAIVRSERPSNTQELERLVSESMQARMLAGQLDECPITIEDLNHIRRAFVDVLRGLQHPRIIYPPDAETGSAPAAGDGDHSESPLPGAGSVPDLALPQTVIDREDSEEREGANATTFASTGFDPPEGF